MSNTLWALLSCVTLQWIISSNCPSVTSAWRNFNPFFQIQLLFFYVTEIYHMICLLQLLWFRHFKLLLLFFFNHSWIAQHLSLWMLFWCIAHILITLSLWVHFLVECALSSSAPEKNIIPKKEIRHLLMPPSGFDGKCHSGVVSALDPVGSSALIWLVVNGHYINKLNWMNIFRDEWKRELRCHMNPKLR